MNGSLPTISNLPSLLVVDVSDNNFTDDLSIGDVSSLKVCSMSGNQFLCPVTWQSLSLCQARSVVDYVLSGHLTFFRCVVTSMANANISLRLYGEVSSFDSDSFLDILTYSANMTRSRLKITGLRSGR